MPGMILQAVKNLLTFRLRFPVFFVIGTLRSTVFFVIENLCFPAFFVDDGFLSLRLY